MKSQLFSGNISVRKSPVQGYGVFADQDFKSGELIEECKVLQLQDLSALKDFLFKTPDEKFYALPLGSGTIYNHAQQFNAGYYYDAEQNIMVFFANQKINKGEEIFISYGQQWFAERNLPVIYPLRYRIKKLFPRSFFRFALITTFISCLLAVLH